MSFPLTATDDAFYLLARRIVTPQLGALLTRYSFAIAICLKYRPWMSFPLTATDDAFYLLA
jgi:hypothetical protein